MNAHTNHSTSTKNSTEERALQLLGAGVGPEQVAAALGVTTSRISQLLSDPEFSAQVAELRFNNLQKHNVLDSKYDEMEDQLVDKLKDCLMFMHKPGEILNAIRVINAAKRRGVSAPEQITQQNKVINLVMPTIITQQFTTNINNQVIKAGTQTLETIQTGNMKEFAAQAQRKLGDQNGSQGTKLLANEGTGK